MKPRIYIKYVKRAKAWCKTTVTKDEKNQIKQTQEWFAEKPKEEE